MASPIGTPEKFPNDPPTSEPAGAAGPVPALVADSPNVNVVELKLPDIVLQVIQKGLNIPGLISDEFARVIEKNPMLQADLTAAKIALLAKIGQVATAENIGNVIQKQLLELANKNAGKNVNHPGVAG